MKRLKIKHVCLRTYHIAGHLKQPPGPWVGQPCFTTFVGQSVWSRHCYWLSCLTYGQLRGHREIWWATFPQI